MTRMIFDGLTKDFVTVLEKKLPYWAPLEREVITPRSGISRLRRTNKEVALFPVKLLIEGFGRIDLTRKAEELADWLVTKEAKRLSFSDDPEREYLAVLSGGANPDEIVTFAKVSLEFMCLAKLGLTKQIDVTSALTSHTITGQDKTPWTSKTKFTAPQSQFVLESDTGKITLNYEFIAGDVLEIDYAKRDIKLNGVLINVGLSLESVWFELIPGQMQLRASHATELKYTEKFY